MEKPRFFRNLLRGCFSRPQGPEEHLSTISACPDAEFQGLRKETQRSRKAATEQHHYGSQV